MFKAALLVSLAKRPAVAPLRASFRPRAVTDMPLLAGILAEKMKPVSFKADTKFGNHLGGLVNRIEGVNARLKMSRSVLSTGKAMSSRL